MQGPLRILTVVGARPQIIKAAAISRAAEALGAARVQQTILHTGQHYDDDMSRDFFAELGLPEPAIDLALGYDKQGDRTTRMAEGIRQALKDLKPDVVLVYGDTDSTLAAALAADDEKTPLAHVEAGLRSHDESMPEEFNRIECDRRATWLFCPTTVAVENLRMEGFHVEAAGTPSRERPAVRLTGDVMYDNSLHFACRAEGSGILRAHDLSPRGYFLATVHRAHNTDAPERLEALMYALMDLHDVHGMPVVLPLHPRTRARLGAIGAAGVLRSLDAHPGVRLLPPAGFLDMVALERNARLVLTDSGGVQKEAFFLGVPVVVLRAETEWTELVEHGWAILADADPERIATAVNTFLFTDLAVPPPLYGDGHAAERILAELLSAHTDQ